MPSTFLRDTLTGFFGTITDGRVASPLETAVSQLLDTWEDLLVTPRPESSELGRSLFDRIPSNGTDIPFSELPLATQMFLGGPRLIAQWYAPLGLDASARPSDHLRSLVTSQWRVRTTTVEELREIFATEFAKHFYWQHADTVPCDEYRALLDTEALFSKGRASAPVVFFDGRPHGESVAYALALVRFATPESSVLFLEGTRSSIATGSHNLPAPLFRIDQWSRSGYRPLPHGIDDPDATHEDRDYMRSCREAMSTATRLAQWLPLRWMLQFRINDPDRATNPEAYSAAVQDRLSGTGPVYAGGLLGARGPEARHAWHSPPSREAQARWLPPAPSYRLTTPNWSDRIIDLLSDLASGARSQRRNVAPARRRLGLEELDARFGRSPLRTVLPELAELVGGVQRALAKCERNGMSHAEAVARVQHFEAWGQVRDASLRAELDIATRQPLT